jgi:hypothetical protein
LRLVGERGATIMGWVRNVLGRFQYGDRGSEDRHKGRKTRGF